MSQNNSDKIHQQYGFVNNLFIGLSTAVLTFIVHLVFIRDFSMSSFIAKIITLLIIVFILSSLVIGIYIAWIRVEYYRKIERHRDMEEENEKKENLLSLVKLERKNRKLLKWQGITFLFGILLLAIFTFIEVINKF